MKESTNDKLTQLKLEGKNCFNCFYFLNEEVSNSLGLDPDFNFCHRDSDIFIKIPKQKICLEHEYIKDFDEILKYNSIIPNRTIGDEKWDI